jgi:polyhydroxybutyrate depolymerase
MRVHWERHPAPRAETLLYIVEGGGHTWPGGEQYMPEWLIGKTCQHFDANVAIWAFLKRWRSA